MSKPRKRNRRPKVLHVEPVVEPVLTEADVQRIRETDGAEIDVGKIDNAGRVYLALGIAGSSLLVLFILWNLWKAFR